VPLAATVNGEEITLAEYQDELKRYQAEVGTELATEAEQRVLNELIDQLLLAQGAAEAGYLADEKPSRSVSTVWHPNQVASRP